MLCWFYDALLKRTERLQDLSLALKDPQAPWLSKELWWAPHVKNMGSSGDHGAQATNMDVGKPPVRRTKWSSRPIFHSPTPGISWYFHDLLWPCNNL